MVISLVELVASVETRLAIVEVLGFAARSVRTKPSCLGCDVYEAADESRKILYVERWRSTEDLHAHIQSAMYLRILNAIDLAQQVPRISFYEVSTTKSMELIEALRVRQGT
jgi:quinol monooxygenase YgiN